MIEVRYDMLDERCFTNYLNYLISSLFKGLCLKEEGSETLIEYLSSLLRELVGSKGLIEFLKYDARFVSVMNRVQYLIQEKNISYEIFRSEIFTCINIINKLLKDYKEVGDSQ